MLSGSYVIGKNKLAFPTYLLLAPHTIQAAKTFPSESFIIHKPFHFTVQITIALFAFSDFYMLSLSSKQKCS